MPSFKPQPVGHRPVTSCLECRQHKVKCNAQERYPQPCLRCERNRLPCEIDPEFRPRKGLQIQNLRNDLDELRAQILLLRERNRQLQGSGLANESVAPGSIAPEPVPAMVLSQDTGHPTLVETPVAAETYVLLEPELAPMPAPESGIPAEYVLGDVTLSAETVDALHATFVQQYLPFLPILATNSAHELYNQLQLLFWTVCLTASLLDPDPSRYIRLLALIKQLAIETCWIRTPRSTHIIQALLVLAMWPLPNHKVLDDALYRFVGLAKNLLLQLGLHRGKFMGEFSRTQVALPDAEKWRTRTWLAVFFGEQFWALNLGLPPSLQTDYLLEQARIDPLLPKSFRCLVLFSIFQLKLVLIMGLSVTSPDGVMDGNNRKATLAVLERELDRLAFKIKVDEPPVECYYLYVKLMVCVFAFLPGAPIEDQTKYITTSYLAATRIVTLFSRLAENHQVTELPIYVRHAVLYAVLLLFRLHLTPYLEQKYVDSARQSIVTVHRLFRNMLSLWKEVQNDLSRTARALELLNFVILTYPELFTTEDGIISHMRLHLTGSLFYDLIWRVHEARRRQQKGIPSTPPAGPRPVPLPFYNQITKDAFTTFTTTTPEGTSVTTLVPTDSAMLNATTKASEAGLAMPTEINGIPLAFLEATGSVHDQEYTMGQVRNGTPKPPASLANILANLEPEREPELDFDTFFQQHTLEFIGQDGDDFLGWFDQGEF